MRLDETVYSALIINTFSLKQEEMAKSRYNEDTAKEKNTGKGSRVKEDRVMQDREG